MIKTNNFVKPSKKEKKITRVSSCLRRNGMCWMRHRTYYSRVCRKCNKTHYPRYTKFCKAYDLVIYNPIGFKHPFPFRNTFPNNLNMTYYPKEHESKVKSQVENKVDNKLRSDKWAYLLHLCIMIGTPILTLFLYINMKKMISYICSNFWSAWEGFWKQLGAFFHIWTFSQWTSSLIVLFITYWLSRRFYNKYLAKYSRVLTRNVLAYLVFVDLTTNLLVGIYYMGHRETIMGQFMLMCFL